MLQYACRAPVLGSRNPSLVSPLLAHSHSALRDTQGDIVPDVLRWPLVTSCVADRPSEPLRLPWQNQSQQGQGLIKHRHLGKIKTVLICMIKIVSGSFRRPLPHKSPLFNREGGRAQVAAEWPPQASGRPCPRGPLAQMLPAASLAPFRAAEAALPGWA